MIQAIIFDFDGVLYNSEPVHYAICEQLLSEAGFSILKAEYYEKCVGLTDRSMLKMLFKERGMLLSEVEVHTLVQRKIELYHDALLNAKSLQSIPGVLDFLKFAEQSISKFAVCSNGEREAVCPTLAKLEEGHIAPYMKFVITLNDLTEGKPAPEGYLKAAHYLEMDPSHCLVIEDSPTGILAGKRAGMTVIGLTTSFDASSLQKADHIATDYHDVQKILQQYLY